MDNINKKILEIETRIKVRKSLNEAESVITEMKKIKKGGLTPEALGKITMIIVGSLAIIAGILSLPQIDIQNPSFLAVKGIISILAIVFIILQTWVAK